MKQGSSVGYWDGVWIEFKKDSLAYVSFFFIILLVVTAAFESFLAGNKTDSACCRGEILFSGHCGLSRVSRRGSSGHVP